MHYKFKTKRKMRAKGVPRPCLKKNLYFNLYKETLEDTDCKKNIMLILTV